ncbi:AidA/PixA family protein [Chitinophaga agri]|uniref:AidA/PixA family protein n=1 Tax=Chitinophaga agri TaxID=2703787 RepID=UPI00374421AB
MTYSDKHPCRSRNTILKSPDGLPAITKDQTFCAYHTGVARKGTENFVFKFAIYTLDETRETQQRWGYCQRYPQIKVS